MAGGIHRSVVGPKRLRHRHHIQPRTQEQRIAKQLHLSCAHSCEVLRSATEKFGAGSYIQASMIAARYGALGAV